MQAQWCRRGGKNVQHRLGNALVTTVKTADPSPAVTREIVGRMRGPDIRLATIMFEKRSYLWCQCSR